MTVASAINLVLVVLCLCVMVQGVRMDRRIRALRDNHLDEAVARLDGATQQARLVLNDLKYVLATEAAAQASVVAAAQAMRDELTMMVDIGNSVAERISDAAREAQAVEVAARERSDREIRRDELASADVAGRIGHEERDAALASARTAELSSRVFDILSAHLPRGSAVA